MTFVILFACLLVLILLISWVKFNPFIAFIIVSIIAGLLLGLPAPKLMDSIQKGLGDTLGSLVIIITLSAMLGKIVAESGAAQKIAAVLMQVFGKKYLNWALMATGFIVGIPLFYNVGFVLMVPLIFSVVYQYKLPAVYIGLPMLAALSVTHGFLPPHPSPVALVQQFNANTGLTLLYGLIVAIPTVIIAGPIFSSTLKNIPSTPLEIFRPKEIPAHQLPGTANSFITALLPVFLLIICTLIPYTFPRTPNSFTDAFSLVSNTSFILLIAVIIAACSLGLALGKTMKQVMHIYAEAVKDIGMILLIIAGASALKQVLLDSGVSAAIGVVLASWSMHPLLLGWIIAAIIRVCVGSATVAGLTAAGIIAPYIVQTGVNPNLMVLSVGAGSLFFSHVNDSGFWMYKEYFNLSVKDTFKTWTAMETIVSVIGLLLVLLLSTFL